VTAAARGRDSATGLPNVDTWDLAVSPSRTYVVAATHGRGQWKINIP